MAKFPEGYSHQGTLLKAAFQIKGNGLLKLEQFCARLESLTSVSFSKGSVTHTGNRYNVAFQASGNELDLRRLVVWLLEVTMHSIPERLVSIPQGGTLDRTGIIASLRPAKVEADPEVEKQVDASDSDEAPEVVIIQSTPGFTMYYWEIFAQYPEKEDRFIMKLIFSDHRPENIGNLFLRIEDSLQKRAGGTDGKTFIIAAGRGYEDFVAILRQAARAEGLRIVAEKLFESFEEARQVLKELRDIHDAFKE